MLSLYCIKWQHSLFSLLSLSLFQYSCPQLRRKGAISGEGNRSHWDGAKCLIKRPHKKQAQLFKREKSQRAAGESSNHALITPSTPSVYLAIVMKCFMSVGGCVPAYTITLDNIATSLCESSYEQLSYVRNTIVTLSPFLNKQSLRNSLCNCGV